MQSVLQFFFLFKNLFIAIKEKFVGLQKFVGSTDLRCLEPSLSSPPQRFAQTQVMQRHGVIITLEVTHTPNLLRSGMTAFVSGNADRDNETINEEIHWN